MTTGVGRKPSDADYGLGEYAFDADRLGLVDEDELTQRLVQTFSSPSYSPPRLPAVATEMLALSRQRDVEFAALESLLERDAMLAGEVLCLARSAHYSRTRPPATLRAALVRVGLNDLQAVVMQAVMNLRVFRSESYGDNMERVRSHSNATAHLCRIVCRYTAFDEEQAFLCGLLHDVGIAGILLALGDAPRGKQAPDLAALWPAIDRAHARAGAKMVELWKLPSDIAAVVGAHHEVRVDGMDHPLAATVCLAESLTTELGMAFTPAEDDRTGFGKLGIQLHLRIDQSDAAAVARASQVLGLAESHITLIHRDAREWAESEASPSGSL